MHRRTLLAGLTASLVHGRAHALPAGHRPYSGELLERIAMKAYDIEILHHSLGEAEPRGHGWCFGSPPGILPEQWPLDANNGYPLSHGFTILLPPDYRIHGPEIVALSFFATAFDHNDGGPAQVAEIKEVIDAGDDAPEPTDAELLPFCRAERGRHPRMYRMEDLLGCSYAAILLTEGEFQRPFCAPPTILPNRFRDRIRPPAWLKVGAAAVLWGYDGEDDAPVEYGYFAGKLGGQPERHPSYNRALVWKQRAADPNAGRPPRDRYEPDPGGYQSHYYWQDGVVEQENYREHDWARGHLPDHIGGTMRPVQAIPPISPFYIEFEEYFGGYNFGGGNGWLDFRDMKFDWSQ